MQKWNFTRHGRRSFWKYIDVQLAFSFLAGIISGMDIHTIIIILYIQQIQIITNTYDRSWIGFKNLLPISATQSVLDKFYNKNLKFTRAVDELDVSIGTIRGRRPIHEKSSFERYRAIETNNQSTCLPQTNSFVTRDLLQTGPIVKLTRLTNDEIACALSCGKLLIIPQHSSGTCERNYDETISPPKKYNLRSRRT